MIGKTISFVSAFTEIITERLPNQQILIHKKGTANMFQIERVNVSEAKSTARATHESSLLVPHCQGRANDAP